MVWQTVYSDGVKSYWLQHGVADCVLRRSEALLRCINANEILNSMLTPVLTFLTPDETEKLEDLQETREPPERVVRRLLNFIKARQGSEKDDACRKLVACIVQTTSEERGHRELEKIYRNKLPNQEWRFIDDLCREINDSPMASPYRTPQPRPPEAKTLRATETPERPFPLIGLQGQWQGTALSPSNEISGGTSVLETTVHWKRQCWTSKKTTLSKRKPIARSLQCGLIPSSSCTEMKDTRTLSRS